MKEREIVYIGGRCRCVEERGIVGDVFFFNDKATAEIYTE